jgi:hypothetical protein
LFSRWDPFNFTFDTLRRRETTGLNAISSYLKKSTFLSKLSNMKLNIFLIKICCKACKFVLKIKRLCSIRPRRWKIWVPYLKNNNKLLSKKFYFRNQHGRVGSMLDWSLGGLQFQFWRGWQFSNQQLFCLVVVWVVKLEDC